MLTPEIRKAIYGVLAAVLVLLSVFQVVDDTQSAALLDVADQVLAALALILAFRNVKPAEGIILDPPPRDGWPARFHLRKVRR